MICLLATFKMNQNQLHVEKWVIYADLNLLRNSGLEISSPSPPPQNICQGLCKHQFPLKFVCVLVIIIIILSAIGFSVSVMLIQKSSTEKHVPESRKNTTEPWKRQGQKCLTFSSTSDSWNTSQTHCSKKESTLLLIQDAKELNEIQRTVNETGMEFWIGLTFSSSEKKWKWINDSFLNPTGLKIVGDAKENSCASISKNKVISENCDAEVKFICQKELYPVSNEGVKKHVSL
ncbi:killer cell lectin-like receptor subfamily B member 1 isoform X2 [Sorex fumeus]|uniref:killer cell lectin-like receptor subfamily B member 1 isoform X2 n=1 Tax=Sorex fumeus TaxID=62283 RepID=UPI0024AD64BB|nr:killer cell lectin-like receptor subfamily B member 1 isoform X2 [Sorex fumeus]